MTRVVLLVENLSVPTDPRVWNQAKILSEAGYDVTVVCPTGSERDQETSIEIDGIQIRRFTVRHAESGVLDYLREYVGALVKMVRIVQRLDGPIDIIHSANPPDFLFLVGLIPKLRWKTKLLFDHHDLTPELFESRFSKAPALGWFIRFVERINFATADAVLSTNESYRNVAIDRGRKRPDQVWVVRNAKRASLFANGTPDPTLRRGKPFLALYVGVIGQQDGADCAIRAAAHYRYTLGRDDLHLTLVGDGDALPACKELAKELDVIDMVEFAGWQEFDEVLRYLSSADIGMATDPPSPLNDQSTMIKVLEYLAVGLPIVSFDLPESVISAGDAALYAKDGDELELANNIARLIDDPDLRATLAERARERSSGPLSWSAARDSLLEAYAYLESER